VNSTKRFLAKLEYRIQLDELFTQETDHLIAQLDTDKFAIPEQWNQLTFRTQVQAYEATTERLTNMAGVLGRWGNDSELPLALDIISSLHAHAEKPKGGLSVYLNIRSYPAALIFTAYGLGLTRAGRWRALHDLLSSVLHGEYSLPTRTVDALFLWWKGTENDVWKQLEGLEQRKTPYSDRLFAKFSSWSKNFLGFTSDFELIFERFEMLGSLVHRGKYENGLSRKANGRSAKRVAPDACWTLRMA
jgi:hypothetical protein